ncbi:MAG: cupin-like domain-containing protein [Ideonella sp.]|nr:cupin-like domain-containing protein [Ideonella sp.]
MQTAQLAELEPGDAIFIPSMWWHHVEALDNVNVLVNYWWRSSPAFMDPPIEGADAGHHESIRDLPPAQRQAWAAQFQHYVFAHPPTSHAHIPASRAGHLGLPLMQTLTRLLQARFYCKNLNR